MDPLLAVSSGSPNLGVAYVSTANAPMDVWDYLGLIATKREKDALFGVHVKNGCCCVNHIGLMHMSVTDRDESLRWGYDFTVYANVGAKENSCNGACKISWRETSNRDTLQHKRGIAREMAQMTINGDTSTIFDSWRNTKLTAPTEMHAMYFADTPRIGGASPSAADFGLGTWTLLFDIVIYSAEGCPCSTEEVSTSFRLTLNFLKIRRGYGSANHTSGYAIVPNWDASGVR